MTAQSKKTSLLIPRARIRIRKAVARLGLPEEYFLVIVAILIGAATGVIAHLFFTLIEFARAFAYGDGDHEGLYVGRAWMLLVLPVGGAIAVGYITRWFASEAKGHGVPEVMDALYRKGGVIRPRVASAKAITSALTIGSGGSAGTEGPIIQIGAAIGSTVGQLLHLPKPQMSIVVACGISAGIAAIFNAPIAGVLFALEVFLKDFSFRTFSPVIISSVISCSIMHAIRLEDKAIFEVSALRDAQYVFVGIELPYFLVLGLVCGVAAVLFIWTLYAFEDITERLRFPEGLKPALGACGLGLSGWLYVTLSSTDGIPPFFGNGYPVVQAVLGSGLMGMTIMSLCLLFVLKLLATSFTLGSGGSGGVFAPSLLMGAALGGAFGLTLQRFNLIDETGAYALVGMAAFVAATTHAPLMAIVMVYEITQVPKLVLPVMFAAIIATALARMIQRDSIYTLKLRRRGVRIGSVTDLTVLRRILVSDVPHITAKVVQPDDPLQAIIAIAGETEASDFAVVDEHNEYRGMVTGQDIRTALLQPEAVSLLLVGELMRTEVPTVAPDDTLDILLDKFARSDVESLAVAASGDSGQITGLVTRRAAMRRYQEELDRQS